MVARRGAQVYFRLYFLTRSLALMMRKAAMTFSLDLSPSLGREPRNQASYCATTLRSTMESD